MRNADVKAETENLNEILRLHPWQLEARYTRIAGRVTGGRDWPYGTRHYMCSVERVGYGKPEPIHFEYSQGPAHTKAPTLADLVRALLQDASTARIYGDEWEMAREYGMTIEDKAGYERMVDLYRACERVNDWFDSQFSPDEREQLEQLFEDF